MSVSTHYDFSSVADYVYDVTKILVSGGNAKLIDQRPTNATFFASFNTNQNGNWGNGTLTGTLSGAASVSGGYLNCSSGQSSCDFSAVSNADSTQLGCVRVIYQPEYSGTPSAPRNIFLISNSNASLVNILGLYHNSVTGQLFMYIYNSSGVAITSATSLGVWSPTAGTDYEIEFNWDLTMGAQRVFINGVQFGSTQTFTGIRSSSIGLLRLGSNYDGGFTTDQKYGSVLVFSTVQHASNYTPGPEQSDTIYSTLNPTIKPALTLRTSSGTSFSLESTITGSDNILFTIEKDGVEKWYSNGWTTSTGTITAANSASVINTNFGTLFTIGSNFRFVAYLKSSDGTTTPQINSITTSYGISPLPNSVSACEVYGFVYGGDGSPLEGISIQAQLNKTAVYNNSIGITQKELNETTDSQGFWSMDLVENESMTPSDAAYHFRFIGENYFLKETRIVPNTITAAYHQLETL